MRTMTIDGRFSLVVGDGYVDVFDASDGDLPSDPQAAFARWAEIREWADALDDIPTRPIPVAGIGSPAPLPPQIFAIGLNYKAHAAEGGTGLPTTPQVFTKFPGAVGGPFDTIGLPAGSVDFEAELVAIVSRRAEDVPEGEAWSYVAGLTVGQDLSERELQTKPPLPQFSLGKSFRGFAPMGPALVSPDEFDDPDDLELSCRLNGEVMQHTRTSDLIFSVPTLVSYLSTILPLFPGDAIFTGTPSGIGFVREPKVLLKPGDVLETEVGGVGTMRHGFIDRP